MKHVLSILLAIALLLPTCFVIPAAATDEDGIPPEIAAGTVVWDVDQAPADLTPWMKDLWPGSGGISTNEWSFLAADGKGVSGKAMGIVLYQDSWARTSFVRLSEDSTALTDWTGATELMFYINGSEVVNNGGDFPVMVYFAYAGVQHPDHEMRPGYPYYVLQNGQWTEKEINDWGWMFLPEGYTGWVRVPFSSLYSTGNLSRVDTIYFQLQHNVPEATVYFDQFMINATPGSNTPSTEPSAPDTSVPAEMEAGTVVWDLENAPENLSKWAANKYAVWGTTAVPDTWEPTVVQGKGVNGSAALCWTMKKKVWGNATFLGIVNDSTALTNWTGATELMFYIDASEMKQGNDGNIFALNVALNAGLDLNKPTHTPDAPWYLWEDGAWKEQKINSWGNMLVPNGYCGYIRLPLSSVTEQPESMTYVSRILFHIAMDNDVGASVYFDNFTINIPEPPALSDQDVLEQMLAWPEGKKWCVTLSYDDGQVSDRKMVEILNKYGVKCTFNLIGTNLTGTGNVSISEVGTLYAGHEAAVHTWSHPNLTTVDKQTQIEEFTKCKELLEQQVDYEVRGMAYPYGGSDAVNDEVVASAKESGIVYGRTTVSTYDFKVPVDWLRWPATLTNTAGTDKVNNSFELFIARDRGMLNNLFYLWGHSYEFTWDQYTWDQLEGFCQMFAEHSDKIWFATNIEVYDYATAARQAKLTENRTRVENPSEATLWIVDEGQIVTIAPGKTYTLGTGETETPGTNAPSDEDNEPPKTGDFTLLGLAVLTMTAAGTGLVIIKKKD